MPRLPWLPFLICHTLALKIAHRTFVDGPIVRLVEPRRTGFRVVLAESLLQNHLVPNLLPTIYAKAVPLKEKDPSVTVVRQPNQALADANITIAGLRQHSWYYVCVEWENFSRYNESTGTVCNLHRTLDKSGRTATSTLSQCTPAMVGHSSLSFVLRSNADFPLHLSAWLSGTEQHGPSPSLMFAIQKPTNLRLEFGFLVADRDYGELCFLEEPLVGGYTALGRSIEKIAHQTFVEGPIVRLIEPRRHGFRVVLADSLLEKHLNLHSTIYVKAIPLRTKHPGITVIRHLDRRNTDPSITIAGLHKRSWYYVCVEWEKFSRYKESVGAVCQLHRTLDHSGGRSATSTLTKCTLASTGHSSLNFMLRSNAHFPLQISAWLQGSEHDGLSPTLTFTVHKPTKLRLEFGFLLGDRDYGQLCFLEEPLVGGYTALGRSIGRVTVASCCLSGLRTAPMTLYWGSGSDLKGSVCLLFVFAGLSIAAGH